MESEGYRCENLRECVYIFYKIYTTISWIIIPASNSHSIPHVMSIISLLSFLVSALSLSLIPESHYAWSHNFWSSCFFIYIEIFFIYIDTRFVCAHLEAQFYISVHQRDRFRWWTKKKKTTNRWTSATATTTENKKWINISKTRYKLYDMHWKRDRKKTGHN